MSLRDRVVSGIIWTFLGGGTQIVLKLIVVAVLARLLNPQEFGTVAGAMLVVYFLELLGSLGVGPSIVQRKGLSSENIMAAHIIATGSAILLSAILFINADAIAKYWDWMAIDNIAPAMGLLLILRSIGLPAKFRITREFAFRQLAVAQILAYLIGFGGVGLSMAFMGYGLWALVGALLIEAVIHTVICLWFRFPQFSGPLHLRHFTEMTNFGIGASTANALSQLSLKIDEFMIAASGDAFALGLYSRAKTTGFMPINRITGATSTVLFSAFSSIQDERARVGVGLRRTLFFYTMIIFPGVISLAIMGPEVVALLLGAQWTEATILFQILTIAFFLRGTTRFSNVVINSFGRSGILVIQQLIFALVMVLCCWFGFRFGTVGIAIGVFVATFLQSVLTFSISATLIGWPLLSLITAVGRSLVLGVFCASIGMLAIGGARLAELAPIFVIMVAGFGLAVGGLTVVLFCPKRLLGDDGLWIFDVAARTVLAKVPVLQPFGQHFLQRFESSLPHSGD